MASSNRYDLQEAMKRLPPLQIDALRELPSDVKADAVPYWPYQQETFPYFWNRISSMQIEELAGDIDIHRYNIEMALVIGHLTENKYTGLITELAYPWIVGVLDYFENHPDLISDAYQRELDFLWIERGGAVITGIPNGTRTLANSGVGNVMQIAIVFTLDLPLLWQKS